MSLLDRALRIIKKQPIAYYRAASISTNDIGLDVSTYQSPVTIYGSVQAVPRSLYQYLGLDLQKNYINVHVSADIVDVKRDVSGDQISFNGKRYQCESKTDWFAVDGWVSVLCVEVS